ncbi:acyltransferase family protein [Foetidibacter luteolus]|uniref:acyltransferase family protein n=1 Tax=Foetidibacter luteolus TaxID=2608880 RepID=UPI00129AD941|nr:acyltransferase [Foetidibacter luteolus]
MLIKPLTSLRFFFALLVFLHHIRFVHFSGVSGVIFGHVASEGFIGVGFFFILSGFVLSLNYMDGITGKKITARQFWIARFARIYPLHLLTLLIALPMSLEEFQPLIVPGLLKLLLHVLLLQSFIPVQDVYFAFNVPSWSLSNEMFFYLLFPFIVTLIARYKKSLLVFALLIIALPVAISFSPRLDHHRFFYVNPFLRLTDFIIGILIFMLYSGRRVQSWFSSPLKANICEVTAVLLLAVFFRFHNHVLPGFRYSSYYWLPMAFCILAFAYSSGFLSKWLSNKTMVHLGEISFSFYMFHQLVIRVVTTLNSRYTFIDNSIVLILFILFITLVVSHFSYLYVEKPCNRYIKARFTKRVGRVPVS